MSHQLAGQLDRVTSALAAAGRKALSFVQIHRLLHTGHYADTWRVLDVLLGDGRALEKPHPEYWLHPPRYVSQDFRPA